MSTATATREQFQFETAVRVGKAIRISVDGPTDSGKSLTSLQVAATLAKRAPRGNGRFAVIDTENGESLWYADKFDFDVHIWKGPYSPDRLVDAIDSTVALGYSAIVIDSTSHFWSAGGGVLDIADRSRNSWAEASPAYSRMVEAIVNCPIDLVATVRSKMKHLVNDEGVPFPVGMGQIQRDEFVYEFSMALQMDRDHTARVVKGRFDDFSGRVIPPGLDNVDEFVNAVKDWIDTGEPLVDASEFISSIAEVIPDPTERQAFKRKLGAQFGQPDNWTETKLAGARLELATVSNAATAEEALDEPAHMDESFAEEPAPAPAPEPAPEPKAEAPAAEPEEVPAAEALAVRGKAVGIDEFTEVCHAADITVPDAVNMIADAIKAAGRDWGADNTYEGLVAFEPEVFSAAHEIMTSGEPLTVEALTAAAREAAE